MYYLLLNIWIHLWKNHVIHLTTYFSVAVAARVLQETHVLEVDGQHFPLKIRKADRPEVVKRPILQSMSS